MTKEIFTVGHSEHSLEGLFQLLQKHRIEAVADVRSQPYSKLHPHFNRESLERALKSNHVAYVFLGRELGGRTENDTCYVDGKIDYEILASTAEFQSGIDRVLRGIQRYRIALLCAEKDPLHCHRSILISRHLAERGVAVSHILGTGALENHQESLKRLLLTLNMSGPHMFRDDQGVISLAYQLQGEKIGFSLSRDAGVVRHGRKDTV